MTANVNIEIAARENVVLVPECGAALPADGGDVHGAWADGAGNEGGQAAAGPLSAKPPARQVKNVIRQLDVTTKATTMTRCLDR